MANITKGILSGFLGKEGMAAGAKQFVQDLIRSTSKLRAAGKPLLRPVKSRWVTESVQPLKSTTVAPQAEKVICWLVRTIPITDKTHAVCCNKDGSLRSTYGQGCMHFTFPTLSSCAHFLCILQNLIIHLKFP